MKVTHEKAYCLNPHASRQIQRGVSALAMIVCAMASIAANATTYYVDGTHPQATDSNPGTQNQPWLTIQHAADTVVGGDTVIVKTGVYNERVSTSSADGTAADPIMFRAEPRRTVDMEGFVINGSDYVRIEGFNISTDLTILYGGGGIWIGSDGIEVLDCYFEEIPNSAVRFNWSGTWPQDCTIRDNRVFRCQFGFMVFGQNILVEDNEVERLVQHVSSDSDYSRFFGDNITFRGNRFHGTRESEIGGAHVDGLQTFSENDRGARNCLIERNYIESFHEGILMTSLASTPPGTETANITIRNNVLVGGELGGAWGILIQDTVSNIEVYHNTLVDMKFHGIGVRFGSSATVRNNIFYNVYKNYWADSASTLQGGYNLMFPTNNSDHIDPNDLRDIDPQFVDYAGGNYRLEPGSAAIDAALDLGVPNDISENVRPAGAGPDIGAYEFELSSLVVPHVIGLQFTAAETAIDDASLVVGDITEQPSTTVPIGEVIDQTPTAGTEVSSGSNVDLVVSIGVVVPNVVGLSESAAATTLTNAGLVVGTVTEQASATIPVGQVISQSPNAGAEVDGGWAIDLVVSAGAVVPNVVGQPQFDAESIIVAAGLVVGTITDQSSTTVPAGHIISQTPAAGTEVSGGAAVDLVISTGVLVPNVVGQSHSDAESTILAAGLTVGTVTNEVNTAIPAGQVISQSPTSGTQANGGSAVDLVISAGSLVPNVVGQSQSDAEAVIVNSGLVVGTVAAESSATTPIGHVINQSPTAGAVVAGGSVVTLVVSTGVTTPDVVDLSPTDAANAIVAAGLTVGSITEQANKVMPDGKVVSQNPTAGVRLNGGSPVDLVISASTTVPDVVGESQSDAENIIINAGLTVGSIKLRPSKKAPVGEVMKQTPRAGTPATEGMVVDLVVSKGAKVPHVIGSTKGDAKAMLVEEGLILGDVLGEDASDYAEVVEQDPPAGTYLSPGTPVNLVVVDTTGGPVGCEGVAAIGPGMLNRALGNLLIALTVVLTLQAMSVFGSKRSRPFRPAMGLQSLCSNARNRAMIIAGTVKSAKNMVRGGVGSEIVNSGRAYLETAAYRMAYDLPRKHVLNPIAQGRCAWASGQVPWNLAQT